MEAPIEDELEIEKIQEDNPILMYPNSASQNLLIQNKNADDAY